MLKTDKLKYSAAEMFNLIKIFNLLIHDLVPDSDPHWELYLMLREITSILNCRSINNSIISYLQNLISQHHSTFINLFEQHLRPKYHFAIHYPSILHQIGPIVNISSMRYESKHQEFKQMARVARSRKNLLYTLALKYQLKISHLLLNYNELSKDLSEIKYKENLKKSNAVVLQSIFDLRSHILVDLKYIKYNDIEYKAGLIVQIGDYEDGSPLFGIIKYIVKIQDEFFFCLNELETKYFDHHINIFVVENSLANTNIKYESLVNKYVYNIVKIKDILGINYF